MIRAFVGISVPEDLKDKVERFKEKISSISLDCKFVEKENIHVSLSFLGNVEESELENLKLKLNSVASQFKEFSVKVGALKFIPSLKYARVLAFDVSDETNLIRKLSSAVKSAIGGDVKPPHLTVCRLRKFGGNVSMEKLVGENLRGEFKISSIKIFQNKLSRNGPTYAVIHEAKLS